MATKSKQKSELPPSSGETVDERQAQLARENDWAADLDPTPENINQLRRMGRMVDAARLERAMNAGD